MKKLFDLENPVFQVISRLTDLTALGGEEIAQRAPRQHGQNRDDGEQRRIGRSLVVQLQQQEIAGQGRQNQQAQQSGGILFAPGFSAQADAFLLRPVFEQLEAKPEEAP